MCCFTRPVDSVSATNIFARADEGNRQFVVYSMTIKADEDLAMVLPLPVAPGSGEEAVRFINLKDYPDLFADLHRGFPPPPTAPASRALRETKSEPKLKVVDVGEFEASFVPTVADFDRLDERFRLPPGTWEKLPAYKSYGFAVFKLKPGAKRVHPMAFSFPRADTSILFFPTVHIHDGRVHPSARFDHVLYCQPRDEGPPPALMGWDESPEPAARFVKLDKAKGIVAGDRHCYRLFLGGTRRNQDTVLAWS